MMDCLVSGKLIRDPVVKTSANGNNYIQFLLSVSQHGESDTQIISAIAFDENVVERVAKLQKGDSLACAGVLKQTEWADRATNELKHGLSITVNQSLSIYDIQKRRKPKEEAPNQIDGERAVYNVREKTQTAAYSHAFDDPIEF